MQRIIAFRNPQNGYEEPIGRPWLWTLLFGFVYFAVKGIWTHALASAGLAVATAGLSWFLYPFFARKAVERHYLKLGWDPIRKGEAGIATTRPCPHCYEIIRVKATKCRFCGSSLSPAD